MVNDRRTGQAAVADAAELQRVQKALRTSESEFRTLVELMPQIVWVTRPDGWHIDFNQHWLDYTGLTLEESLGFGWNGFYPASTDVSKRAEHSRSRLATLRRFRGL